MEIIFLGTGGGRWITLSQKIKTGGFRIHTTKKIHIDPGPGAIVSLSEAEISPIDTDVLIITHCHPDHYNDGEILIEAMTYGMTKNRGILACSESVLFGKDGIGPGVSKYHQSKAREIVVLKPGEGYNIDGIKIETFGTKHSDPVAVGLKIFTPEGVVTYTSDTEYFDGVARLYSGSDVIIFNVIRPQNDRIPYHYCTDDVIRVLKEVVPDPTLAIMQHFGMKMLGKEVHEARRVEEETGVRTISARDGMVVDIDGGLSGSMSGGISVGKVGDKIMRDVKQKTLEF